MNPSLGLILIGFLFLNWGCVSNPYHEPQRTVEDQAQKYPQQAEYIRQQQREWENRTRINPGPNDTYTLEQEMLSGVSLGGPNADIHLGKNIYQYHHKINLTLVCEKDTFIPKPYRQKNIKWKLTDSLNGEVQTSRDGKVYIYVKSDIGQRFRNLVLMTSKNSYDVLLNEVNPTIELKKDDCL